MTTPRSHKFRISSQEVDGKDSLQYSFYIDPPEIHSIIFKGGGMRVFLYQKFIEIIEENGLLAKAREVGASSSGALAALFSAIPFEPGKRSEAMDDFSQSTKGTDIIGEGSGWFIYRLAATPLDAFSKIMTWSAEATTRLANQFRRMPLGVVAAAPLNLLAYAFQLSSNLTPELPAAIYNLLVNGGLFIGDELQNSIRKTIHTHTQAALQAYLKNLPAEEANKHIADFISIGLLPPDSNLENMRLNPDLNFRHFHHLANLPDSQFKEIFITGARKKDFKLKIFNYRNTPDMSIHEATRITMSIPYLYQDKQHELEAYIDGGCVNNYPMRYATSKSHDPQLQKFGVHDNQARLGVRVERGYEKDVLWNKPRRTAWESFWLEVTRLSHKFITSIDTHASDALINQEMQNDYAHRTIQIDDQGISLTEFGIGPERRQKSLALAEAPIREQFANHAGEKVFIKNFDNIEAMNGEWLWLRESLLETLSQQQDYDVFCLPGKSELEVEMLRLGIINKLKPSTNMIFERIGTASPIANTATPTPIIEPQIPTTQPNITPSNDYSLDNLEERIKTCKF